MTESLMELSIAELTRRARIPFRLLPYTDSLLAHFSLSIADEIRGANRRGEPARLILPVGPVAQYPILVEITNRERIDWKHVHVFQMDEFLDWQGRPIPLTHPLSFEGFLRRELHGRIDAELRIPESQHYVPHPFRIGEISERMEALGGADACFGGIGYHGHVAFNEPWISRWTRVSAGEMRASLTRVTPLGADSIVVQSIHSAGGNPEAIPPMAVTLGMRDILASRRLRLYCAAGERHRAVFRRAVAGEVTAEYPVTLAQGHPDAEVLTTEATAQPISVGLR